MFRPIGVGDSVLGTCQLLFDILTAFFRLLTPCLGLDDVGKLNDDV